MSESVNGLSIPKHPDPLPTPEVRQGQLYDPTAPSAMAWASFKLDDEEGFALLSRMKHGERKNLSDCIGEVISLRNAYVQPVESHNEETGEVQIYPWICLEDDQGVLYSCGSHGVYGSLVDLLRFRKVTPWEPALRVKVIQKALKSGRRIFGLLYQPAAPTAEKKGGKRA